MPNWGKTAKGGIAAALIIAAPLIANFEGFRSKAYLDITGTPTICYGSTLGVKLGDVATQSECTERLKSVLEWHAQHVRQVVEVPLNSCQWAALSSLSYNIGSSRFDRSSLLKFLNNSNYAAAANSFLPYVFSKGKFLPGLLKRRQAERALFLSDCKGE